MAGWLHGETYQLHILDKPEQMTWVEDLQRLIWPGDETEIVPGHILLTATHHGGLLIGAFDARGSTPDPNHEIISMPDGAKLVGFVFSFPGFQTGATGIRLKHCSHMLGVHPKYRNSGIGFTLKRAQWQMVRQQKIDWITWTYDPLMSRNAHLNIARLGAVCNTFIPNYYGPLRDGLNVGQPTDRFQVDWWVNSARVSRRLSKRPRSKLDLAHYLAAGAKILNPTQLGEDGFAHPSRVTEESLQVRGEQDPIILVEIPGDFQSLKTVNPELSLAWREHSGQIFENLFLTGYLVTDFIHLPGSYPRSFYILSHGESTF